MDKNTTTIIISLLTLIVGFGTGYGIAAGKAPSSGSHVMANGMMMHDEKMGSMGSAMDDMMTGLQGKTGDAFDKEFLSEMTVHHQGAVAMAQAALQSSKHQEIKDLAQKIITAQTSEIQQMQGWEKSWYGSN